MKGLILSIEQARVNRTELLDWITQPEYKVGKNTESLWIIGTERDSIHNPTSDPDIRKLEALLFLCKINHFNLLIIRKNGKI